MKRLKTLGIYIIPFLTAVLIFLFSILAILKATVFNKIFIKKEFTKTEYYQKISKRIDETMHDYLLSTGLSDEVLNIYEDDDIHYAIDEFLDDIYSGKIEESDFSKIGERLGNNIDAYIQKYDVKITAQSSIDSFVAGIVDIYKNEVRLYGVADNYASDFARYNKIIDRALLIFSVLLTSVVILMTFKMPKLWGVVFLSSGMMTMFWIFVAMYKIDIDNVLLLSENFSAIIKEVYLYIINALSTISIFSCILGIILIFLVSFQKKDEKGKKRLKKL